MSELEQYDFQDVMRACVRLYGHDASMESCTDVQDLIENGIGESEVPRVIEELNKE